MKQELPRLTKPVLVVAMSRTETRQKELKVDTSKPQTVAQSRARFTGRLAHLGPLRKSIQASDSFYL